MPNTVQQNSEDILRQIRDFINKGQIENATNALPVSINITNKLWITHELVLDVSYLFPDDYNNILSSVPYLLREISNALSDAAQLAEASRIMEMENVLNRAIAMSYALFTTLNLGNELLENSLTEAIIRSVVITDLIRRIISQISDVVSLKLTGIATLTPELLTTVIVPFIQAIAELERTICQILDKPFVTPEIKLISQNSPIEINGKYIIDAAKALISWLNPVKRQQSEKLAEIEIAQKELEIKKQEVELSNMRLDNRKIRETAELAREQRLEEIRQIRLENDEKSIHIERQKLQLQAERVNAQIALLKQLKPNISENELIVFVVRLSATVDKLIDSPIIAELRDENPQET